MVVNLFHSLAFKLIVPERFMKKKTSSEGDRMLLSIFDNKPTLMLSIWWAKLLHNDNKMIYNDFFICTLLSQHYDRTQSIALMNHTFSFTKCSSPSLDTNFTEEFFSFFFPDTYFCGAVRLKTAQLLASSIMLLLSLARS